MLETTAGSQGVDSALCSKSPPCVILFVNKNKITS